MELFQVATDLTGRRKPFLVMETYEPLNFCRLQVSKGHSLLADLLRTSSLLPPALRPQAINEDRYAAVLFDYRYFKDREALERKVEASPELTQLDEHFREARILPVTAQPASTLLPAND